MKLKEGDGKKLSDNKNVATERLLKGFGQHQH